ncbi:MAG: hypothetical protein K8823_749 [Cenarchaeum symbiont of Oopsacas minuta]|nr:hypothetical protein [Cenarchaeum symbiont of Oopsacas minuta]
MLKEGEQVPSFTIKDEDGNIVKSSEFNGKKL